MQIARILKIYITHSRGLLANTHFTYNMPCLYSNLGILFSRDWCFDRALGWELQSKSSHRDRFLDTHPCCDFHTMLKPQWLSHARKKVFQLLKNQYLWASCCIEHIWRKAFEMTAVFFLCGGSNHFSRFYISELFKAAQYKQSASRWICLQLLALLIATFSLNVLKIGWSFLVWFSIGSVLTCQEGHSV